VASEGGGAGTDRDEERGHGRMPERAGLGASSTGHDEERGHGRTPERAGLGASLRSSLSRGEQGRRRWDRPGRFSLIQMQRPTPLPDSDVRPTPERERERERGADDGEARKGRSGCVAGLQGWGLGERRTAVG
jgi:hypothetical protein